MKKYFYTDGTNKFGPFTIEELKEKGITRETNVWFQELGEWKPAGSVEELNELFRNMPPPLNKTKSNEHNIENLTLQKPPKTWLVESILVTILCCLPFGIAGIVNASKVESRFYSGDVEGANKSSADAKKWTTIGLILGIVGTVIYLILVLAGVASSQF
ncbi:CD225/dispanin family protein [Saccharicrinis sp. FJH62]|uniref:CD225/dispanin family protein n=1 Tax=Saccharicrinis sp. FJH62 TaxID=3344657 RepID=UPI0035D4CA6C